MAHPFAAPIQDEATRRFNENMAKIEDERRQRGDMPTTTVPREEVVMAGF